MRNFIPRKNQILMEAVRASETATIQLRQFAAATLLPEQPGSEIVYADGAITGSVEITQEGYLSIAQTIYTNWKQSRTLIPIKVRTVL